MVIRLPTNPYIFRAVLKCLQPHFLLLSLSEKRITQILLIDHLMGIFMAVNPFPSK